MQTRRRGAVGRFNFLDHLLSQFSPQTSSVDKDTHTKSWVASFSPCIDVAAQLMAQITCEAAADSHTKSGSFIFMSLCVFTMSRLSAWMAAHVLICHLCMYRKQTVICDILLWVEPCMTTDLYIGILKRHPVAMAPGVADAKKKKKEDEGK